jgi:hypothetical protein
MAPLFKVFSAALITSVAWTGMAWAEDLPPVAEAYLKSIEKQTGVKPTYASLTADEGNDFTITGLKAEVTATDTQPGVSMEIAEISFNDVGEAVDGVVDVGSVTTKGMVSTFGAAGPQTVTISAPDIAAEGLHIMLPLATQTAAQAMRSGMALAEKTSVPLMTLTSSGQTFEIKNAETTFEGDRITGAGVYGMTVEEAVVPEAALALIDPTGQMKALGYAGISMSMDGEIKLDMTETSVGGDFSMGLTSKDMGTLHFTGALGNVGFEVMEELQKANAEKRQPDTAKLTPLGMAVTISGLSIGFEDASITKKVLPLIAKAIGMDEAGIVAMAPSQVQLMLTGVGAPELAKQAADAVGAYLAAPDNISINLEPTKPVSVAEIMAASGNPAAAIALLGLSVTANVTE